MTEKLKIAINWAGACGGCDVSLLDIEEKLLDITAVADIVYWPVAIDAKRKHLSALADNSVDVGIFNGAIRTAEHREDALLLRQKCKILLAFGSCAAFGGICGMANGFTCEQVMDTVYNDTASTHNPEKIQPQPQSILGEHTLNLPEMLPVVSALAHVVDVDYYVPGCPPPTKCILDVVELLHTCAQQGSLPPTGKTLAADKALCAECSRRNPHGQLRIDELKRPHEIVIDPQKCFLEQGLLCMGPATRGGCGQTCINANMPCRGCFGPVDSMLDQGADAISAIGALLGNNEDYKPQQLIPKPVRQLKDPLGTFYRFTLPQAILCRRVDE